MPQGADYIFWIEDVDTGMIYNFDPVTQAVGLGTSKYVLRYSPEDWRTVAIQNVRNQFYKGVDRAVTVPLSFVGDGKRILSSIFTSKGLMNKTAICVGYQTLKYDQPGLPDGSIAFTTGGSPLQDGDNIGTISGPAGTVVYVRVDLTSAGSGDGIMGDITGSGNFWLVNMTAPGSVQVMGINIPANGDAVNINLSFINPSTTGAATIQICTATGDTSETGSYAYVYELLFRGQIDWLSYLHDGTKVTVSALEDGLVKYLKANEKTEYEYPLDQEGFIWVKLDGIRLHQELIYQNPTKINIRAGGNGTLIPCLLFKENGNSTGAYYTSENWEEVGASSSVRDHGLENYFISNIGEMAISDIRIVGRIEYKGKVRVAANATLQTRLLIVNEATPGLINSIPLHITQPALSVNEIRGFDYDITITLQPGDVATFWTNMTIIEGTAFEVQFTENSKFNVTFKTRALPTKVRCLRPQKLFELLVNSVTDGNYSASLSSFFDKNSDKVFTSGNGLRNLPDATIKISLYNFFLHWDCVDSVAMAEWDNNTVKLETEESLIDLDNPIILNSITGDSLKVSVLSDALFNELQIGYPELSNELGILNGKQEFNTKAVFSTNATVLGSKVLERISTVITSCYENELTRTATLLVSKDSGKDYKNDNKNFTMHIEKTSNPPDVGDIGVLEYFNVDRSLNSLVTAGLDEPESIFNLWFSPKRCIIRKGVELHGRFYLNDTEKLFFRTSDQNKDLVCDGVVESEDVVIGNLADQIMQPINLEISAPINLGEILLTGGYPLQSYVFNIDGKDYIGIMQKVSAEFSTRAKQIVLLRSSASNNLSNLNEYIG